MRELLVTENEKEQKLLKLLQKYFKGQNDSFLYKMLRKKNILLNGKKANGKEVLSIGDKIQLYFSEESLEKLSSAGKTVDAVWQPSYQKYIFYEDKNLILFAKPAGLLSENDETSSVSVNSLLSSYLLEKGEMSDSQRETFRPGIANRLDRNTSGLIIFGKNLAALQSLGKMMQNHSIRKSYYALVLGDFMEEGLQESFIRKEKRENKVYRTNQEEGEKISAVFSVKKKFRVEKDSFSLLSVQLLTGKTHQIRSQLSFLNHPILGDEKYGNRERNKRYRTEVKRQLLHAFSLTFPTIESTNVLSSLSGKEFILPLSEDFQSFLHILEETEIGENNACPGVK